MMMRLLGLVLISLLSLNLKAAVLEEDSVELTCEIKACGGTLYLFKFDGTTFNPVQQGKVKNDSLYTFKLPLSEPEFYYLGNERNKVKPLILGSESSVLVRGSCGRQFNLQVVRSPLNKRYNLLKRDMSLIKKEHSKLMQSLGKTKDTTALKGIIQEMVKLDEQKLSFLDSMKNESALLASILAANTYLFFPLENQKGKYPNEFYYFAEQYFKFVDFADPIYNRSSWLYETFKGYTATISNGQFGIDLGRHQRYLERWLSKIPAGSMAYKHVLSAIVITLKNEEHSNLGYFANKFIETYQDTDPEAAAALKADVERLKSFMIGGTPPDFSQATPEGEMISLSDFRGKTLLLDFWASWCGPCRRENPNVVRLYNQYKDKGFEILGISLDNNKERWLGAIDADKLTWHHVSDLKGWRNEVAQKYGVTSIPQTILIDGEGKIIARNLRGIALANKLSELFDQP